MVPDILEYLWRLGGAMTRLLLGMLALGCSGEDEPDRPKADADVDSDVDADADADADTDVDADTDADTDPVEPITVSEVGWRLHDSIETLVWLGWTQDGPADMRVEYQFSGEGWLSSPEVTREAGSHEQILLGIPYDTQVSWRLLAEGQLVAEGDDIVTGETPEGLPLATLESADETRWYEPGRYLLTSINQSEGNWEGGPFWTVILDRQGRAVWAYQSRPWTLFAQVSVSTGAHLLLDQDTMWSDWDSSSSTVLRMTLDEIVEEIPTPGLLHAFVEHPDGTLAWGSNHHHQPEALVELAPGATEAEILWTCDSWDDDYNCESNGLFYDVATDSYLYSFWESDSLVAIDRSSGETMWWAGNVPGGYTFVPEDSQFWLQHGVSYTSAGTLLLSTEASGPTTLVREYEVDHGAGELREVWSFDAEVYAVTNGDAWRLSNGNTLHVVGNAGVIKEAAADGSVVWHVDYHSDRLLGRGEFIEDLYTLVAP
jgi:hypothetical protein